MRVRVSLFTKILLWFFVNLIVLGGVLWVIFNLQLRAAPDSPLFVSSGHRLERVAGSISQEIRGVTRAERTAILRRYSDTYKVEFLLYADTGDPLAGDARSLPPEVVKYLTGPVRFPPPPPPGEGMGDREPGPPPGAEERGGMPPGGERPGGMPPGSDRRERMPPAPQVQPTFSLRTTNPTRYWAGVRLPVFEPDRPRPVLATLLAISDSISGHGLFFDVTPWLFVIAVVLGLSILLWLPFVRGLTGSIRHMTAATEQIAEERFDVRVDVRRGDELGRLGAAINHLASRLAGFVGGQKRFLGDISHELNSPLARLQVELSILEERLGAEHQAHVADAQEEVALMSQLVGELLAFAKAGMRTRELALVPVPLRPLAEKVRAREAQQSDVRIEVPDSILVVAQPELLSRALANVLRNAVRYAGSAGPIHLSARSQNCEAVIAIADQGPGVPPETIPRLLDPLFRVEADRARSTGGSGLGLAIVKTCVEACRGSVSARNLSPSGFEVTIVLEAAQPEQG
jgi:two-component system sensor histidine kinase CpxA